MQATGANPLRLPRPPLPAEGFPDRLAELVAHLTECPPTDAVEAVRRALPPTDEPLSRDDHLEVVARAMVAVRQQAADLRARRPA